MVKILRGALLGIVVGVLAAAAVLNSASNDTVPTDQSLAPGTPAYLVERHDCWTGAAPAGVEAGHVVVTRDGRTVYGGRALVEQAIAQHFYGVDHGLTVHGFCP